MYFIAVNPSANVSFFDLNHSPFSGHNSNPLNTDLQFSVKSLTSTPTESHILRNCTMPCIQFKSHVSRFGSKIFELFHLKRKQKGLALEIVRVTVSVPSNSLHIGFLEPQTKSYQSAPFNFKEGPAVNFPGYSEDE